MKTPAWAAALVAALCLVCAAPATAENVYGSRYDGEGSARVAYDLIVIHTAEAPEVRNSADNVCAYLASTTSASVHACADAQGIVTSVPESLGAWTASHRYVNTRALQIELSGYSGQGSDGWADAYSIATLENAAQLSGRWVREHGIPVRHIGNSALCRGERGFIGHSDVNGGCTSNRDNHGDPGPTFPWNYFLGRVSFYAGQPVTESSAPAPAPQSYAGSDVGRNITDIPTTNIQRVVGVIPDGVYGPQTTAAVRAFQSKLGAEADGVWGPQTQEACARLLRYLAGTASQSPAQPLLRQGATGDAVRSLQSALNGHGARLAVDGVFGPLTRSAVMSYQRSRGLLVDGIVGPQTWGAL